MALKTVTIPDPTQADLDAQIALGNYPSGTVLADIALPSDYNAIQPEIDTKQDLLVSGTNIKTINSTSILGSGNISAASANIIIPAARNFTMGVVGTSIVANRDSYGALSLIKDSRLRRTRDGALSGQTADYMANRFFSNSLSFNLGILLMDTLYNGGALSSTTRMIEEALANGCLVFVANKYGAPTTSDQSATIALNDSLKAYCDPVNGVDGVCANPSLFYLDNYSQLFNADGTNKFPLGQTTTSGSTSSGTNVINVVDASVIPVGDFVWCSVSGVPSRSVCIARDTTANTITLGQNTTAIIASGSTIYSHQCLYDGVHNSGYGADLLSDYLLGMMDDYGILDNAPRVRIPLKTYSAAEQTAGATENFWGRIGTLEGTPVSNLHPGLLSSIASGNRAVTTSAGIRGNVQQFTIPAGTAAFTNIVSIDTDTILPTASVLAAIAGRRCAGRVTVKVSGIQASGIQLRFNMSVGNPDGGASHYLQFPASIVDDYADMYLNDLIKADGTFTIYGEVVVPTDFMIGYAKPSFSIRNQQQVPSGLASPIVVEVSEYWFGDIDDPQRSWALAPNTQYYTTSATALSTDRVIFVDSASPVNITLPTSGKFVSGQPLKIVNMNTGTVTVVGTVNGVANPTISANSVLELDLYVDASNTKYWRTAASSGSTTLSTVEKDLGSAPRSSGKFVISGLSGLTTNKPVTITQAVGPYTGKGTRADEAEMDGLTVSGVVTSATEITAYWNSARRVKGNFKFNYFVGA